MNYPERASDMNGYEDWVCRACGGELALRGTEPPVGVEAYCAACLHEFASWPSNQGPPHGPTEESARRGANEGRNWELLGDSSSRGNGLHLFFFDGVVITVFQPSSAT